MATTIGFAFLAAIRLSRMNPARPTDVPGAASGFALGRNQKVRLVEKLRKMLQIKRLRLAKTKIEHKKQRFERLYYREIILSSLRKQGQSSIIIFIRH